MKTDRRPPLPTPTPADLFNRAVEKYGLRTATHILVCDGRDFGAHFYVQEDDLATAYIVWPGLRAAVWMMDNPFNLEHRALSQHERLLALRRAA
jgi:hypothetical protein